MSLRCAFPSVKHGIDIYDHTKVCDGRNVGQERMVDFCDMYGVVPETIEIVTDADMFHPTQRAWACTKQGEQLGTIGRHTHMQTYRWN
jgi:hypothetical protein